ncbi:hypothetical protein HY091_00225 [Candidatus Kaiserbacteria bacterium]|nr:hypothetical protein [Candidatus Kaiserbacteria bacterium]
MQKAPEFNPDLPYKVVTHFHPDTDALACLWGAIRFVVPLGAAYEFAFVRAGEGLSAEEAAGYNVLHVDTGGGDFDQHDRPYTRTSSFELLARHYGFADAPGVRPILALTVRSDSVEPVEYDSIHWQLSELPSEFKDVADQVDRWNAIIDEACKILDRNYRAVKQHLESRRMLREYSRPTTLRNKFVVRNIGFHPEVRNAAFEEGADVVLWTAHRRKRFYPGIQVHRAWHVDLTPVFTALRRKEAEKRGVTLTEDEIANPKPVAKVGQWFLHGSTHFIGCGTRSHPLVEAGEYTQLTPDEIYNIVCDELEKVSGPKQHR